MYDVCGEGMFPFRERAMMVTKEQAEAALASVIERYKGYWDEQAVEDGFVMPKPTLVMDFDWLAHGSPHPHIVWEEGPDEWAIRHAGGINEELLNNLYPEFVQDRGRAIAMATDGAITPPKGVYFEPMTSWALGIYEA